jgi:hypothetical protein
MSQFGGSRPVVIYKHEYVDIHIPPDRFSKPNAAAHASLDAQIERHRAIMGDSEDILNAAQDAETEAAKRGLFWICGRPKGTAPARGATEAPLLFARQRFKKNSR